MAAAINANNYAAGFKATADGSTLLILDPNGSVAFSAALQNGAGTVDPIGVEAPQLLVTESPGVAFYLEMAIGIDVGSGSTLIRPAAVGWGTTEVTRTDGDAFESIDIEMKGDVTSGEIWTLQLRDLNAPGALTEVRYTTKFGDTLSDIAGQLALLISTTDYDVTVRGRVITLSNATIDQGKDITATVLVGLDDTDANSATNPAGVSTSGYAAIVAQLLFRDFNGDFKGPDSAQFDLGDPRQFEQFVTDRLGLLT